MELSELLQVSSPLPLNRKTVINLFYTYSRVRDKWTDSIKNHDISMEQFNVLRILRGQKGKETNLQDLQKRMVTRMSNTTRLVDKLIRKDLVTRRISTENRRKVQISITDNGLKLLEILDPLVDEIENEICSSFSENELNELNILLSKMREF
ncbi:MarR family winged helix-turn-helix transcriptional regulator [Aegicerativicinus sediminis]|uniref:MarR family winged helix-turn-helix transcriptional regulator n=1 Tax=Aegicerativicinus sediminis TaxID=2893202 RepID=UPI001E569D05|nr:MarR family transcriptional regulator [Aegicerativicinus sediminis]